MEKMRYWRELPDGSKHHFNSNLERPAFGQKYYDDILGDPSGQEGSDPLEILYFGKEQSYPNRILNRRSPYYILHYVTAGKGTYNGRMIHAGEGFLIVPGVAHCMASDREDPWHFQWIVFWGSDARRQMKRIGLDETNVYFTFRFADVLERLTDDVLYQAHSDCELHTYMKGIFYLILSYHKKQYVMDIRGTDGGWQYAESAMQYMDLHYWENVRVDDIAEVLHISRKYLCEVLERCIGMSTKEYLLSKRVEIAAELLLQTEMTVSEVAREVGYEEYTQFSRLFRQKKGISPRQFRKQNT